jgi:sugar phosphate isomerase/epimerase
MRLGTGSGVHLCYGTNVHPGEAWPDVLASVREHVVAVKRLVEPDRPFACGLRLSAAACRALAAPEELASFKRFLDAEGLYVFTLNGFPFGAFHGTRVKENVYRPDWLEEERLEYSNQLALVLAELLPDGLEGSISTVPAAFAPRISNEEHRWAVAERMLRHVATLVRIREHAGKTISLAVEPEPCCSLETVEQTAEFVERYVCSADGLALLGKWTGLSRPEAETAVRRHLGVCLDACHMAVEFEQPTAALEILAKAGIRVAKVQLSAGLQLDPDAREPAELSSFADDVYLHQVVEAGSGGIRRYLDLPDALGARMQESSPGRQWRIHFHVPIHRAHLGTIQTTQSYLREFLALLRKRDVCSHLEVETYTWDVLPRRYRSEELHESLAREMRWAIQELVQ